MVLWKLDSHMKKNEVGPLPLLDTKLNSQCTQDPKFKDQNYKTLRRGTNLHDLGFGSDFFKSIGNNRKNRSIGFH